MSAPKNWRATLGFADRIEVITRIKNAFEQLHPESASSAASDAAKQIEENARRDALSLEDYHSTCAKAIDTLLATSNNTIRQPRDQVTHDSSENLATSRTIGRFLNVQHYRDGLCSEVYKARDPQTGVLVALKFTSPGWLKPPHDSFREARILSVARADHIIALLETFTQAGGEFVMVFPFMQLGLDTLLARGRAPPDLQTSILKDLFSALQHLHGLDIIHRDIKPSNILLASPQGPAYVADFGIAWSPTDGASEPAGQKILDVGTTCYRPPELLFGYQSYGTKLDMWSAGCVVAEVTCLGAKTLFDAGDLGSELALIRSIFETLGTPDTARWPEATMFPDWGKMNFTQYPRRDWHEVLHGATRTAVDLVNNLVEYESSRRLDASQVLQHAFFRTNE